MCYFMKQFIYVGIFFTCMGLAELIMYSIMKALL